MVKIHVVSFGDGFNGERDKAVALRVLLGRHDAPLCNQLPRVGYALSLLRGAVLDIAKNKSEDVVGHEQAPLLPDHLE